MRDRGRTVAIVAYLTLIGLIVAFVLHGDEKNRSELGAVHIRQMLGLMLTSFVATLLSMVPFLGSLVASVLWIAIIIGWVLGIIAAINGQREPIPLIGRFFQEVFRAIQ